MYAIIKAAISGILIALISETAKKNPTFGALIASLPLISILSMIWLWQETSDTERIAKHAEATFWYVLPSLPMFLVLPALLRAEIHFYISLALSCLLTVGLYLCMIFILKRFGIVL